MKTLLIFGASKGTGYQLLTQALNSGVTCVALVRNQESAQRLSSLGCQVLIGDATDPDIVLKACIQAGEEATIVSTLGGPLANYHAQITIVNQAEKAGISRMILVTSLGCGDSWNTLSDRAKQAFGFSVREKTLAEQWLQTSQLNYCILRPGGLCDGELTHQAECYFNQEVHGYINRSDLALTILAKSQLEQLENCAFSVIDPHLVITRDTSKS